MKKQIGEYRHLAGNFLTRSTLWEGPDHLLYLERKGRFFKRTETTRRIDYKNIESISYARTRTWWWATTLLGLLSISITISAIVAKSAGDAALAAAMVVLLLVHLVNGHTCVLMVQTAVQLHHLRPLRRMPKALLFANRLSELCRLHQGDTVVDALSLGSTSPNSQKHPFARAAKIPFSGSRLVRWTLVTLLLSGAILAGEPFVDHLAYLALDFTAILSSVILVTIALFRTAEFQIPASLRVSMWGALGNLFLTAFCGFGLHIYYLTKETIKGHASRPPFGDFLSSDQIQWFSHLGFEELHQAAWGFVVLGGITLLFALLGMPSGLRRKAIRGLGAPPPLPKTIAIEASPTSRQ